MLTGDINCDLLTKNPTGGALRSFCTPVNLTQLINKPTRVTKTSHRLLDVMLVYDTDLVQSSRIRDLTISDHFSLRCSELNSH